MKYFIHLLIALLSMLSSSQAYAQQKTASRDLLGLPKQILFNNINYHFSWSSHPSEAFYKQEYIPAGEKPERFRSMLLVDVLIGERTVSEIVSEKIRALKELQLTNKNISWQEWDVTGKDDQTIDFTMTAPGANGNGLSIFEYNVYRYKSFTSVNGKKGLMLFAISTRAYDKNISVFRQGLSDKKKGLVDQLKKMSLTPTATL
ncbi:MAG: hypothetical protein EOO09_14720 [Chitinophagaceae bacterium]|nr:MAG: hypothetical protein EOO09_14720 [Chitinophagaceae bacterium]